MRKVPPEVAKHGIQRVTDNRAGREVRIPASTFMTFFGDEILRSLEASRATRGKSLASAEEGGK